MDAAQIPRNAKSITDLFIFNNECNNINSCAIFTSLYRYTNIYAFINSNKLNFRKFGFPSHIARALLAYITSNNKQ